MGETAMRFAQSLFDFDKLKPLTGSNGKDGAQSETIHVPQKKKTREIPVAVLDIGTSKICCMIALSDMESRKITDIIGIGHHAAAGMKSGSIIDLKAVENAVGAAVQAAENMARPKMNGTSLQNIFVNIPALHATPHHFSVDVRISGHQIAEKDIEAALAQARNTAAPGQEDIVHVIPVSYSVDNQTGIRTPVGMYGHQLGVDISIISVLSTALKNFSGPVTANHLDIAGFCVSPYASGLSCLVQDERDLGCTIIDMGAGTTQIAVFFEGALIYTGAVPVGGQHVTNDIARGLTTSLMDAERLKILYGSAGHSGYSDHDTIDVPVIGESGEISGNKVPRSLMTGIIQPRLEETFEMVRAKLNDEGLGQVAGRRVVLTGGASQLAGLSELARHVLDKQVRLGSPEQLPGLPESTGGPGFATTLGMLSYAAEYAQSALETRRTPRLPALAVPNNFLKKAAGWIRENW
ncbi:MAG: cell division protein FtsA [Micavibrio sp.]|nr:MAG: cell division protein FtsA [Micavibrio sp.]